MNCQPVNPDSLAPLFAPLSGLRGIRPEVAGLIARAAGGDRVIDLLFHMPESYLDRTARPTIKDAKPGMVATLAVEVVRHERPATSRQPWRIVVKDDTGVAELVYFRFTREAQLPPGTKLLVSGKLDNFNNRLTMPHPDHLLPMDQADRLPAIEPVWPLTAGLQAWHISKGLARALPLVPPLPEWHDPALLKRQKWPPFEEALRAVQAPANGVPDKRMRARLAYDELLAGQVATAVIRGRVRARAGQPLEGDSHLRRVALQRFGLPLTRSQVQALQEIDADLASPRRMLRLLQGDVGSGKTMVAMLAMLRAVEAGKQAALMAPTEVLAKQHHRTLSKLCQVPVALLTGSVKGKERARLLRGLKDGSIQMVCGTHALFQDAVDYHDLAVAVIDEQHRFGVNQRLTLGAKGKRTDVLVMTATPIPRTLLLTQWGEMDVSRLTEKPAGRLPIRTTLHSLGTLPTVLEGVARKLDEGAQVYWVCPLVAESEALDVAAAQERYEALKLRFGDRVGLAHGQQAPEARDAALAGFASGTIRLLVATTVVEVGVDVPEATVMVIEHAERFGLAQLHQLRGRVGRGAEASFCLLLHEDWVNETARRRLTLLRDTDDGFLIADEDFRLRGGGDALGTRQAGLPGYKLADPVDHESLLHLAHRDAAVLVSRDPKLETPRGRAIRVLLRLFERTAAMRTLAAG
ncbi:ATP-dependent DNA helicase RecG [Rhodopila globiformis]|uniref:ATP-dependent DNA helicase RecG n=1 Tax=Rhodopila globiformis TaxID=1071 RepID=UPI001EFCB404|nr:ATP-dependent DNA helicase RecG [Rhodopila globiformis]